MEYDFIDDSMWSENTDKICKHIEELEREYEELPSDFDD